MGIAFSSGSVSVRAATGGQIAWNVEHCPLVCEIGGEGEVPATPAAKGLFMRWCLARMASTSVRLGPRGLRARQSHELLTLEVARTPYRAL